ncbi:hypothetical protein ABZS83_13475 [Streptomyces sp. NPDC005426]|uniref:hypothetical protein n=1 Tax=Streptomyces sp. NPDC005426 TaxID=3155344 RepID=UPI0033A97FEB
MVTTLMRSRIQNNAMRIGPSTPDDVLALHDDLVDGCRGLPLEAAAAGVGRTWCEQQAELLLARGLGHLRQAGPVEADEPAGFARTVTTGRWAAVVPPQPAGD